MNKAKTQINTLLFQFHLVRLKEAMDSGDKGMNKANFNSI